MPSIRAQLDHYVSHVLLPRVHDIMEVAIDGTSDDKLRQFYQQNIDSGLKFFLTHWEPVHLERQGEEATKQAKNTIQQLNNEIITASREELHMAIVKILWYLLSLSLEDMDEVPVFSDQLTFSELEVAIRNATRTIA